MTSIFDKLVPIVNRYDEIEQLMADPEVATDFARIQELGKERASLDELVDFSSKHQNLLKEQGDLQSALSDVGDAELVVMPREELESVEDQLSTLAEALQFALLPKDPNDDRDVIVEIRSGTGGREASLFAADLYRLYSRFAQLQNWKVDVMDSNPSDLGGLNKIAFEIQGKGAFSRLKYERGVHRVQRVPETEAQGRIHTSTATVAVLPQADEVEVKIYPGDLQIDTFHAWGHGGQTVDQVAPAVRIVYGPTGLVVVCQEGRSQHKKIRRAMSMLRACLFESEQEKQDVEISQNRRSQVGNAERSEKIRTYNYPQDRITDHRVSTSFHGIPKVMDGQLEEIIDTLISWEQAKLLEEVTS